MKDIINNLYWKKNINDDEIKMLIETKQPEHLICVAQKRREEIYGRDVFARGLIEISNFCKNNCYYCGIRAQNTNIARYRLSSDEVLSCCDEGYNLGLRTFVLQSGEDFGIDDRWICKTVNSIKEKYPDCAITLSLGEKSYASYKAYFDAGADRYLLRHETADNIHYSKLHPQNMSLKNRKECLFNLKIIGFQVGAGFMVGSPHQTLDHIVSDIRFLQELCPDMIGIGPFLPHCDTPFAKEEKGSIQRTLNLISILRLFFPHALIPSTTALATIHPKGREMGLLAGANVVMPNLSPLRVRDMYQLYDDKVSKGEESAQSMELLKQTVAKIGYNIIIDIGDVRKGINNCAKF